MLNSFDGAYPPMAPSMWDKRYEWLPFSDFSVACQNHPCCVVASLFVCWEPRGEETNGGDGLPVLRDQRTRFGPVFWHFWASWQLVMTREHKWKLAFPRRRLGCRFSREALWQWTPCERLQWTPWEERGARIGWRELCYIFTIDRLKRIVVADRLLAWIRLNILRYITTLAQLRS